MHIFATSSNGKINHLLKLKVTIKRGEEENIGIIEH